MDPKEIISLFHRQQRSRRGARAEKCHQSRRGATYLVPLDCVESSLTFLWSRRAWAKAKVKASKAKIATAFIMMMGSLLFFYSPFSWKSETFCCDSPSLLRKSASCIWLEAWAGLCQGPKGRQSTLYGPSLPVAPLQLRTPTTSAAYSVA